MGEWPEDWDMPEQVFVRVSLTDAASGATVSPELVATIANFPRPVIEGVRVDPGPFGWGEPLSGSPGEAKLLRGDVTLQSELGRGSTFTVRVAANLADEPPAEFELSEEVTGAMAAAAPAQAPAGQQGA